MKIQAFILGLLFLIGQPMIAEPVKPRVAICYWGLTRSTKNVYKSHFDKIFNVFEQNGVPYDVFMHTWVLNGAQYIQEKPASEPIDYEEYKLLKPTYFQRDDQDLFTADLDMSLYFSQELYDAKGRCEDGEWDPRLIFNHLCALESLKRVTAMVYESGNEYDYIMYVRPDVMIETPFRVSWLNLPANGIAIPDEDHHTGYNDRFAILPYAIAPLYGNRIDHIADFRKNHGRINSEKYVKHVCQTYQLKVRFLPFHFTRVRPSE